MLERIPDLPADVYGLRATGVVSKGDYDKVVEPMLEEARREGRRVRFLYHLTPEFEGFTPAAAWEDARIGLRYLRLFDRCAVVTDKQWVRGASRFAGALLPCPVRVFEHNDWSAAVGWVAAPPSAAHIAFRLLEDRGVLVLAPSGRLSVEDFDALALAVDPWIESGHALRGVVVHAREFPGWQTIGSFFRHVRFIRDHQKKVRRVAVAIDGALPKLAPALIETFVAAEARHFDYAELDQAIEWAADPRTAGA